MPAARKKTTKKPPAKAKKAAPAKAKKAFDVKKPGDVTPSATSRPVIVGHKSQAHDDTIVTSKEELSVQPSIPDKPAQDSADENAAATGAAGDAASRKLMPDPPAISGVPHVPVTPKPVSVLSPTVSRKKIVPLSESEKSGGEETAASTESADSGATDAAAAPAAEENQPAVATDENAAESIPVTVKSATSTAENADAAETANPATDSKPGEQPDAAAANADTADADKPADNSQESSDSGAVDALAEQANAKKADAQKNQESAAKAAEMQKIIDSKEYFVPIGHESAAGKSGSSGSGILVVVLVLLLLAAGAYVAIDAGLVDVGVKLPMEFIKN